MIGRDEIWRAFGDAGAMDAEHDSALAGSLDSHAVDSAAVWRSALELAEASGLSGSVGVVALAGIYFDGVRVGVQVRRPPPRTSVAELRTPDATPMAGWGKAAREWLARTGIDPDAVIDVAADRVPEFTGRALGCEEDVQFLMAWGAGLVAGAMLGGLIGGGPVA